MYQVVKFVIVYKTLSEIYFLILIKFIFCYKCISLFVMTALDRKRSNYVATYIECQIIYFVILMKSNCQLQRNFLIYYNFTKYKKTQLYCNANRAITSFVVVHKTFSVSLFYNWIYFSVSIAIYWFIVTALNRKGPIRSQGESGCQVCYCLQYCLFSIHPPREKYNNFLT